MKKRFVEETISTSSGENPTQNPTTQATTSEQAIETLVAAFEACTVTAEALREKKIPERPKLLGEWLRHGDLGFIFAPRGRGKTWLSMAVAKALAKGQGAMVGGWIAQDAQQVLYVDGEMNLDQTSAREKALKEDTLGRLKFLHHDLLFLEKAKSLNLTDPLTQTALSRYIVKNGTTVLMMDNLSSLFYGLKENEADSWELVLPWLLDLRRKGITVIIVHHSGTDGSRMRGTTKREDHAHWVMRLDSPKGGEADFGARFLANFTKIRNCPPNAVPPIEFYFKPDGTADGEVTVEWAVIDSLEQFRLTLEQFGTANATEISEETGFSKGYVSKLSRQGVREGWCVLDGRNYQYKNPTQVQAGGSKERDFMPL